MTSPGGKPLKEPRSIFQGRFLLTHLLGKGGFGEVYAGLQTSNKEPVAVKIEQKSGKASFLFHEARVMKDIQKRRTQDGIAGIATLKYFGQEVDYRVLIMTLQGPSIEDYHEYLGRFSLQTTIFLADQMLSRLEYVHGAGYVHRDLKADNFVVGRGGNASRIFMIDFGLSSRYLTAEGTHREPQGGKAFLGTSRFASLRTHQGISQSRRDDLEQLVYLMVYMFRGRLPWSGLNIKEHDVKQRRIGEIKSQLSAGQICAKCPHQFEDLLYYVRNMEFSEEPQYDMCRVLIRSILDEENPPAKLDYMFDWDKPRGSDALKPTVVRMIDQDIQISGANGSPDRKGCDGNGELPNVVTSTAKANGMLSGAEGFSPRDIVSMDDR